MELRPNTPLDPSLQDLQEFSLDKQDIEMLRYLVWSDAWAKFFEPLLRNIEKGLIDQLLNPSIERKNERSDECIRGSVHTIRAILNFPAQVIQEADAEAEEENKRTQEQRSLQARASHGFHNPHGPTPREY